MAMNHSDDLDLDELQVGIVCDYVKTSVLRLSPLCNNTGVGAAESKQKATCKDY